MSLQNLFGNLALDATLVNIYNKLVAGLGVSTPLPGTPLCGQKKIASGGTAVVLGSAVLANGVVVKAAPTNTAAILVGDSSVAVTNNGSGNGYPLAAGESISFAVSNLSSIWINGAANDFVAYAGN